MEHVIVRLAGVGLLVGLTVVIHGAATMLVMDRQMRVHLGIHRDGKRQLVNRAVTLLVFELLLLHIAECIIWGIYFYALGVFDQFRVALYFAAVTYTTLGYGDVVAGPAWILEVGALSIVGWLMFGWSTGVLVWILGRHYGQLFPDEHPR